MEIRRKQRCSEFAADVGIFGTACAAVAHGVCNETPTPPHIAQAAWNGRDLAGISRGAAHQLCKRVCRLILDAQLLRDLTEEPEEQPGEQRCGGQGEYPACGYVADSGETHAAAVGSHGSSHAGAENVRG